MMRAESALSHRSATDRSERRERKMQALLERNHQLATVALKAETVLMDPAVTSLQHETLQALLLEVPEHIRPIFVASIEGYFQRQRQTEALYLSELAYNEEMKRYGMEELTPESWGPRVYAQLTGARPIGGVTFERTGGYFTMTCEKDEDGKKLDNRWESIGGFYHSFKTIRFGQQKETVQLVVIRERGSANKQRTVIHERQHFLNDWIMSDFDRTENGSVLYHDTAGQEHRDRMRRIKDEVLAMVRDQRSGASLKTSIHLDVYAHLFRDLLAEERVQVEEAIDAVASFLDARQLPLYQSHEARGVFVYQLAAIPLERFPVWLPRIEAFYRDYLQLLRAFDEIYPVPPAFSYQRSPDQHFEISTLYDRYATRDEPVARAIRPRVKQGEARLSVLRQQAEQALNPTLSRSELRRKLEPALAEYRAVYNQIVMEVEPLLRNGILPPSVSSVRTYEYGQQDYDAQVQDIDSGQKISQAVIDGVVDVPQEDIDEIFAYVRGDTDDAPRSYVKLEKRIKDIVHRDNESRPCWVYGTIDDVNDVSVILTVHYLSPRHDRECGIKGAKFDLVFQSSAYSIKRGETEESKGQYTTAS